MLAFHPSRRRRGRNLLRRFPPALILALAPLVEAAPVIDAVLDAASGGERIGLNTIVSVYGKDLAPCTEQAAGELPTSMCGGRARVLFNGTPLGLFFASENQINALFDGNVPTGTGRLQVINREKSGGIDVTVRSRSPQIFVIPRFEVSKGGFAAVQRFPGYELVDFIAPAESEEVLVIYGTGFGARAADPLPDVFLDGRGVRVLGAAASPGFAGLFQAAIELSEIRTGIHLLQLCYESGKYCSQPVELPAIGATASSYFGGWTRDVDDQDTGGLEILLDGDPAGTTSPSGAFLINTSADAAVTIEIDGGARYHGWRDEFTAAPGWNLARAVSQRNEPRRSGIVWLLPKREAPDLEWSYQDGWLQAGEPMTLLDLMRAYGGAAGEGCGASKIFRRTDDEYPIRYQVDGGPPELSAAASAAAALWNTPAFSLFQASPTAELAALRIVEAEPPDALGSAAGVVNDQAIPCVSPLRQTLYVNPVFREDLLRLGATSEEIVVALTRLLAQQMTRAFGWFATSPSPAQIMHPTPFVDQPHAIEIQHAHYWNSLPNGTLLDKFTE